ncbi:hypothetical protein VKT23_002736 [Stygiomarasmius scandens]|uniref:Uncharacterized protein n=1 Tax=Marasmiellus scandens TaxID=2682957 RepID=A0ABR1K3Z8_9AGAR
MAEKRIKFHELGRVLGEIEKRAQESQKRDDEREKRELEREKKDERREKEWRDWEKKVEERLEKTRYLNGSVANGDARHSNPGGLVTPPSPRSLSSDSDDARHRRRRSGSGRGRRRRSVSRGAETDDTEATLANDEPFVVGSISGAKERIVKRFALTGLRERHKEEEEEVLLLGKRTVSGTTDVSASGSDVTSPKLDPGTNEKALGPVRQDYDNRINAQTAFGVLVLSVAAAAVVWRVKPQT